MFAPENHIRWTDLVEVLEQWSNSIVLAAYLKTSGGDPNLAFGPDNLGLAQLSPYLIRDLQEKYPNVSSISAHPPAFGEYQAALLESEFASSIVLAKMLTEILLNFDTLICSPTGTVMRAPEFTLLHADRLDWCMVDWPLRSCPEYTSYFKFFDEGALKGPDILDRFCFIDADFGLLTIKNNSKKNFGMASHFGADATKEIDRFIDLAVAPFLGWSIVWNGTNFPADIGSIIDSIGVVPEEWNIQFPKTTDNLTSPTPKKRGARPTGAKDEYLRRYPDGKPDLLSYDAISAELTEAGFPISGRQIQNYESERNKS